LKHLKYCTRIFQGGWKKSKKNVCQETLHPNRELTWNIVNRKLESQPPYRVFGSLPSKSAYGFLEKLANIISAAIGIYA
jgi:hypothetical protein